MNGKTAKLSPTQEQALRVLTAKNGAYISDFDGRRGRRVRLFPSSRGPSTQNVAPSTLGVLENRGWVAKIPTWHFLEQRYQITKAGRDALKEATDAV